MNARIKIIRKNSNIHQQKYDRLRKRYYDKKRKDISLTKGDKVLYDVSQAMSKNEKSLIPNYTGPFIIDDIYNDGKTLEISDMNDKAIHFTTDIKYCKLYHDGNESPTNLLLNHMNDKLQYYSMIHDIYNNNKSDETFDLMVYYKLFATYLLHPQYQHLPIDHPLFYQLASIPLKKGSI